METIERNSIFTNCALTDDGDVWWEGMTGEPPEHAIDWKGNDWTPESDEPAAHPNARFTTPAAQCPSIAPEWEDPAGVPIDAFLFGGRRATVVPLVTEAFDWEHGVFLGATMSLGDDRGRRRRGRQAALRPDGDAAVLRLQHGRLLRPLARRSAREHADQMPRIFVVNWFRKDDDGKFLWPGFGENSRVLEWVFRRCDGEGETVETPIGLVPRRANRRADLVRSTELSSQKIEELAAGPRSGSGYRREAAECSQALDALQRRLREASAPRPVEGRRSGRGRRLDDGEPRPRSTRLDRIESPEAPSGRRAHASTSSGGSVAQLPQSRGVS